MKTLKGLDATAVVLLVEIQIMSGVVNAECNLNYKHNSTPRYTSTTWGRIASVHLYRERIFNCKTKQMNLIFLAIISWIIESVMTRTYYILSLTRPYN
jgi:hypothetical protein